MRFENYREMQELVRSITGSRWSATLKCWHIPQSKTLFLDFKRKIPAEWELVETGEFSLPEYQEPVKKIKRSPFPVAESNAPPKMPVELIDPVNLKELDRFVSLLEMKAYSSSTIRTYRNEFSCLLQVLRQHPVKAMSAEQVKRYVLYCINELRLSENSIHSRLNALKFYFEQVLKRDKIFVEIPRPKKPLILPKVLGEQELGKLFKALENKKHKAILFTAYSAGLRVSEVVSLQLSHIDSDRMQIFVEKAKGKKDRYVMLSPVLLDILRNYLLTAKPRPQKYLFEGNEPGVALSSRVAQHIFLEAKQRAGLTKHLSFHSLRHSFATHLLESGVDIKYIKELLGHFSINTTNRYLHVKKEMLVNIKSPLDELYKSGDLDF